jgi:hypothetical protein
MDSSAENSPAGSNEDRRAAMVPPEKRSGCDLWSWVFALFVAAIVIEGIFANRPSRIPENALRTDTRVLGKGIANAIIQFSGDYPGLPLPPGKTPSDQGLDTDSSAAAGLIRILLGREPEGPMKQNTRNIDYLQDMKDARPGPGPHESRWIRGVVREESDLSVIDSWGHAFHVRLDVTGAGVIANPIQEEVEEGRKTLPHHCIVWSAGKDGKEETWEDNIKSWD